MENKFKGKIMKCLTTLLCLLFFCASCTEKKDAASSSDNSLWVLDVTKDYPTKEVYLQDIAEVEYIPLETNDSILWIGREIIYMDEDYIVGGTGESGVYFHDRTGKVLHSFHRKGPGPEEYTGFTFSLYDKKSDEVVIRSFDERYVVYDKRGNFKRSFRQSLTQDLLSGTAKDFFILNEKEFIEYLYFHNFYRRKSRQTGEHLGDIKLPAKDFNVTLAYHKNNMRFSTAVNHFIKDDNGYILTSFSSDTTYLLNANLQLTPIGVRIPPVSSMEKPIFLFPAKNTTRYYFMYTVKKVDDFPRKLYMLDKKENQIYYLENYFKNKDFEGKKHGLDLYGPACKANLPSNVCVESLNVDRLREAYQEGKLSGKLKDIAANLKEDDNPVLMVVKFKE